MVCPDHSELVKTVGQMDGKLDMLIIGQGKTQEQIADLYCIANRNDKETAIERTRVRPVFWGIAAIGLVLIDIIIRTFLK
jgi:hypothetical protein